MNKSEFIVGNKYIITESENTYPWRAVDTILTAKHDDGTDLPEFYLPDGMADRYGDDWISVHVNKVTPYIEPATAPTPTTPESIQPFVVMGVGSKWHILKPSGERVNVYFNTTQAAFAVAKTLAEVYHA